MDNKKETSEIQKDSADKKIAVDKGSYEKNNRTKLISSALFLLAMTILVLVLFLSLGELGQIKDTFMQIASGHNYLYLILAVACVLIYFFLYSFSMTILGKKMGSEADSGDIYLIACSEHFFNDVTPFAAGGQPFQVYSLTKKGLTTGKATGLVLANFIVFLTVCNIYNTVSLCFFPKYVSSMDALGIPWLKWIALLGFIFNYCFWIFIIALGFSKKTASFLVNCLKWVCKIKWVGKRFSKKIPIFEAYCQNVQVTVHEIVKYKRNTFFAFLSQLIAYAFYFSIPFFLSIAVGLPFSWSQYPEVMFSSTFAIAATGWIPTPGGTGGIEYAFKIVITSLLGGSEITPVISGSASALTLLWRLLTYYFTMIVSFICNAVFEGRFRFSVTKKLKKLNSEIEQKKEARQELKKEEQIKEEEQAENPNQTSDK